MNLLDLETRLWQKWMHNSIYYRRIHNHINQLFYYNDFIRQKNARLMKNIDYDRLDIETTNRKKTTTETNNNIIPRSFINVIIPGMFNIIFVIGALPFVLQLEILKHYKFFQILPQFIPKSGPRYVLTLNVIWSTMQFFQMFYGISTRIERYSFLYLINLNDDHHDNDGRLESTIESNQFRLFRNRLLSIERCLVISIATIGPLLMLSMIIKHSAWKISIYLTIFWAFVFHCCIWYICSSTYQFPTIIVIVQYYLILKQKSLKQEMYQFQNRLYNNLKQNRKIQWMRLRLIQLNQDFIWIQKEIASCDQQLKRYLNILFIGFDLLITYLTCLIFLVNLSIEFLLIYTLIYFAHIGLLAILIFNCSKIVHFNREFLKLNKKCLYSMKAKSVLTDRNFYKLDSVTNLMLEKTSGFSLFDGTVITSRTFFTKKTFKISDLIY
uniref:Uncharacterized protein LOC113789315 n=1 Tax=Dermatophagoides pteronyssinus TaxID=6956 RepID=A0A6P6XMB8_DERPT|nr:uncharacterized protein LOC113789315 [Dermatophagoides pteronyssinus]